MGIGENEKGANILFNTLEKHFLDIPDFYLIEKLEECKSVKYKNSKFFMIIYINYYNNDIKENSEEKILKDSIKDYLKK